MNLDEFDFELPENRIAQFPADPRDSSRLLVVSPNGALAHHHFYELDGLLQPGDVVVMNNTKVIPARIRAFRQTGAAIEVLLNQQVSDGDWMALIRPAKRVRQGEKLWIGPDFELEIVEKNAVCPADGSTPLHRVRLIAADWVRALDAYGQVPIPHYIRGGIAGKSDLDRYQTVVANQPGAVAAPTAGLHFTDDLMFRLASKGVNLQTITLHVGYGTFKPISVSDITQHAMHEERYHISESVAGAITRAKEGGHRIIAVGTTVIRCLESAWGGDRLVPGNGATSIYIYPGYKFNVINALITNFHLPKSSLFVLVSALMGVEVMQYVYRVAVQLDYRFYSYGDAMLLWPND